MVVIGLKIWWERSCGMGETGSDRAVMKLKVDAISGKICFPSDRPGDARRPRPPRALSDGERDCLPLLRLQPGPPAWAGTARTSSRLLSRPAGCCVCHSLYVIANLAWPPARSIIH